MKDNTIGKQPKFKEGDVIYIASTNDRLYCSLAYGLYKGIVRRVYKDIYAPYGMHEDRKSIEYHMECSNNPFINDVCEKDFVLTEEEFKKDAKMDKEYKHFCHIGNFLFKII